MSTAPSVPPSAWERFRAGVVQNFHSYGHWLASISWLRFTLLSILLLIVAGLLGAIVSRGAREEVTIVPGVATPPVPPTPPVPGARGGKGIFIDPGSRGDEVTISIDRNGVRIAPRGKAAGSTAKTASGAASAAAEIASDAATATSADGGTRGESGAGVEIKLPPGADSAAVREAVEEARSAVVEAIRDAQREAEEAAQETKASNERTVRTIRRIQHDEPPLVQIAFLWIVASAILKISYAGRIKAEVKAAAAAETAESEQLKRQVAEARMAALQAQVEPHFLFNTLASIDHLIETDPARASQMQKNLIALLRASMPSMREAGPAAHNLGREMAVIRPYLEILKVRMEDRLQTRIDVPDGLLSAEFPPMMIQSLVENAIKHGLEPKAEGGELRVGAEIRHGKLAVTVADTGLGFGKAATAGTGVGLENIRERLKLLYGDKAGVTVADNAPSGTLVTLSVPYLPHVAEGAGA